jgi:hypothetical protein
MIKNNSNGVRDSDRDVDGDRERDVDGDRERDRDRDRDRAIRFIHRVWFLHVDPYFLVQHSTDKVLSLFP